MYDLRELGISAPQELAFGFGIAMEFIRKTIERGLDVDEFAPRRAFYCSSHIDFFEEIAKLRAARRMWAKIMTERFGAKDPRSITFKFGVHTAGCSLVPQQPLNNAIRVAYEAMAAVLAGVQSLHCCSYDEPICLPTEESQRLAIRTQQILAYETGVARVSDPMGGSYYLESLTDQIEAEAWTILDEIESMGGMIEAIRKGWVDREVETAQIINQKEIDEGKRIIVGVNAFTSELEDKTPGGVHVPDHVMGREQAERIQKLKKNRDNQATRDAISVLGEQAEKKNVNLLPAIMAATKASATMGEIMGTIREAYGHHYDPVKIIKSPFMGIS
jgi:methylmalonyl-CoA mutase N-terminal domain/subunit